MASPTIEPSVRDNSAGERQNSAVVGARPPQFVEGASPLIPYDLFLPNAKQSLWIFAYGSLIWNPEFPVRRRSLARVYGFHRALCMRSTLYRGTVEAPGLVLGLKAGGSCLGAVLEIDPAHTEKALEKLWFREMRGNIYTPRVVGCEIFKPKTATQVHREWQTGAAIRAKSVQAVTFIANCSSPAYTPDLCPDEATKRVANCRGERGSNLEYVGNTVRHLEAMGIHDRALWRLYSESVKRCK